MQYVNIRDYFDKDVKGNVSDYDRRKLQEFRDTLNSFHDVKEQAEYIAKWRMFKENRDWDYKVLGIERSIDVNPNELRSSTSNRFYARHVSQMDRYFNMEKELSKMGYHSGDTSKFQSSEKNAEHPSYAREMAERSKAHAKKTHEKLNEANQRLAEAEAKLAIFAGANNRGPGPDHESWEEEESSLIDEKIDDETDNSQRYAENARRQKDERKRKKSKEGAGGVDKDSEEERRKAEEEVEKARKEAEEAQEEADKADEMADKAEQIADKMDKDKAAAAAADGAGKAGGSVETIKVVGIVALVIAAIILITNLVVYLVGGFGAVFGHTPFQTCDEVQTGYGVNISSDTFKKTVTRNGIEISLPANVWYYSAVDMALPGMSGVGYDLARDSFSSDSKPQLKYYTGTEEDRGKGVFFDEDYLWSDGTHEDPYGVAMTHDADIWSINVRWEYSYQKIDSLDYYSGSAGDLNAPNKDRIQPGLQAGEDPENPYGASYSTDAYWTELFKLRFLVYNPATHKACICYAGDGHSNPNWGPALEQRYGGLSQKALDYLEYVPGNTDKYLEVYIIDVETTPQVGPYTGIAVDPGDGCGGAVNIIDTTSAAAAASSLSWGGFPTSCDTGAGAANKKKAYHANGVPGYYDFLDTNLPGGSGNLYGCCASFVSSILFQQGMMDWNKYKAAGGSIYYTFARFEWDYCQKFPDEWKRIYPTSVDELMPGDIFITWYKKGSGRVVKHVAIFGAARGPGWIELCQASYGSSDASSVGHSESTDSWAAWSSCCTKVYQEGEVYYTDKHGHKIYIEYYRFIGKGTGKVYTPG